MNNNRLIIKKSWQKRNWKWFAPLSALVFLLLFGLTLSAGNEGNLMDIVNAYSDNILYEKAIEKANKNHHVVEVLGTIEPLDRIAILEGNTVYSEDKNSVELTVRVKGNKGKGKMDINAVKVGNEWNYKTITIRTKKPKEVIEVLNQTTQKQ